MSAMDAKRRAPVAYGEVGSANYRLTLPRTFSGTGVREVPAESRRVELWSGYLRGDAPARVVVHFEPLRERTLNEVVRSAAARLVEVFGDGLPFRLAGAKRAHRLDGMMYGYSQSPAELERVILVFAVIGQELLTFRVTSWARADVEPEMEKIVASFRLA